MSRKGRVCGRSLSAGPGSCNAWWDGCPSNVKHCFQRWVVSNGGAATMEQAEQWHSEREREFIPELPLEASTR